jgi:tryptophanase
MKYVIPTHQGRSAENLMMSTLLKKGQYVLNNTHFDTTRGNTLHKGGIPIDLPASKVDDSENYSFNGNMNIMALEEFIHKHGSEKIAMVIMTITNNSVGGLPVSMKNIKDTSEICKKNNIRFFFDCARFAENTYFIKHNEPGYENKTTLEIAQEMFSYSDGAMMSAKKDGMSNIGGFITIDDEDLYRQLTELMIIVEGFCTYGGLAGRDLDVIAVGFNEALDENYLEYRIGQVKYLGERLKKIGFPIVEPTGGHAVFVDAGKLLPHIPADKFPGQSLTNAFYLEGGIRTVEIGSLMFGGIDPNSGEKLEVPNELVRMALPRRVYTASHIDFIIETASKIYQLKDKLTGYEITRQSAFLRHFTCDLKPVAIKIKNSTVDN